MKISHSAILALALFLLSPITAHAANSNGWEIVVRASKLPKYFDFTKTNLKSIVKLSVGYEQGDDSTWKPYETMYYNGGQPIGLNKIAPITLSSSAGGQIRIDTKTDKPMDADECDAIANAAGRLFLDLYLKKYPVYDIIVPDASFDNVVNAFQRGGFYQSDPSNSPHLVLSIVSDPPGRCQGMAF